MVTKNRNYSDNEPDGIINTFSKKAGHFNFSSQLFCQLFSEI
jgi:hypothetical protein